MANAFRDSHNILPVLRVFYVRDYIKYTCLIFMGWDFFAVVHDLLVQKQYTGSTARPQDPRRYLINYGRHFPGITV